MSQILGRDRPASQVFILVTVFLDILGIGLIVPVLPSLVGQFTHSPEEQAHWYGWLSMTYGAMQFLCTPMLGALSDRFGRRPVLLISNFGLACSLFTQANAQSLLVLLLIRIVSGGTASSFSVASAYTADVTPEEQRGRAFGLLGATFGLGFIFGPMIGGLLSGISLRLPFYIAGSLAMLNWLYGFFVLPESLPRERRSSFSMLRANPLTALFNLTQVHGIGLLVVVYALAMFSQVIVQSTWALYTQFRFGWSPRAIGMSLCATGLIAVVVQGGLLGRLLRRFGERRIVLFGFLSSTLAFLAYGTVTAGWMMYVVMVCNLMAYAAGPAMQTIISKAANPGEQGLLQGSLTAINGLNFIVAPWLGTTLLALVGHLPSTDWRLGVTFYLCSALSLAALLTAYVHFRRRNIP